ncbi:hypothetical protein ACNKHM_01885 [Shigella sonnei]
MDKNRVFAQRLRQSYKPILMSRGRGNLCQCRLSADMRDEEMVLRDEEVTGELPEDFCGVLKSLTRSANSWRLLSKNNLPLQNQTSAVGSSSGGTRISSQIRVHVTLTLRALSILLGDAWRSASTFHRTASEMAAD